jgi:hypothetical protein
MSDEKRAELLEKIKKLKEMMDDVDDIDIGQLKKNCERIEDFIEENNLTVSLEECPFYTEEGDEKSSHHVTDLMDLIYRAREKCPFCGAELFLY